MIFVNYLGLRSLIVDNEFSMKLTIILGLILSIQAVIVNAQVIGKWKTIGDIDKTEKAIVEIYEQDGKLFGKVIKLLPTAVHSTCERCSGDLRGKPIEGMVILMDLTKTPNGGKQGKVLDPSNGNVYKAYIELEEPDKLKLRGYLGTPTLGRTQYWYRVK